MVAVLTLLTMVFAAPAQAVTVEYNVAVSSSLSCSIVLQKSWGSGCYRQNGDYFWVTDDSRDGYSTGVIWRHPSSGREGICHNKAGQAGGVRTCNKDFPENTKIRWRIARCDADSYTCKHPGHWRTTSGVIEETT